MTRRDTTRQSFPTDSFVLVFRHLPPISLSRTAGSTGFGRNSTCCIFEARLHSPPLLPLLLTMRHFVPHSLWHTISLPVSVLPLSLPPCLADGDSASRRCLWPRLVHCWQWRTLLLLPFTLPVSLHGGHIHSTASAGVLHSSPFRASAERIHCSQSVLTMKGMQGCCGETESRSSRCCSHAHQTDLAPRAVLVEDESCHTPRADRGGFFTLSRDQQSVRVSSEPFSDNCKGCALLSPSTDSHRRQSPCDSTQPHAFFGTYLWWRTGRRSSTNIVRSAWKATSTM